MFPTALCHPAANKSPVALTTVQPLLRRLVGKPYLTGSGKGSPSFAREERVAIEYAHSRGDEPEARLITVKLMRVPGNPLIKGTFWLDDVELTPVPTADNNH